jgi:uncharacterized protein (TIGR02284 family)
MSVATETTSTLNDLIQICLDGEKGFAEAADHVKDASLKRELMEYSTQRRDFAADLQSVVAGKGGEPSTHGDASAGLHRAWINVKAVFTSNDRHAVLAECERGEDSAVAAYKKAQSSGMVSDAAQLVQSQASAVKRTHDRIKALRDAAAN